MSYHIQLAIHPEMIFTRDFREFVRGEFRPGSKVTIRYNPYRIVPPGEDYRFGDPARPVVAHLQFKEGGPVTDVTLVSLIGSPDHIPDWTERHVPKLDGEVTIPEDADWVTIWFSYKSGDGREVYDSNWGKNYRFRFYREEISILDSFIRDLPDKPLNEFVCRIASDPKVEWMKVRYRVDNVRPLPPMTVVDLHRTDQVTKDGKIVWETRGVLVPNDAVVAYDIVYSIDGRPFKDNNQGSFFLACLPEVLKREGY
jgi:uncharacterized protein DUF6209